MAVETFSSVGLVEVIREGRRVPLLPVQSTLSNTRVRWDGITLSLFANVPACEIPDHDHPTHLVSLLTSGSPTFEWCVGGRTGRALHEPGHLYMLPVGTRDRVRWDRPTSRLVLTLEPKVIANALEETANRDNLELQQHWTLCDRHIAALMQALRADLEDGSPAGPLYGESVGLAIAVYLARRYAVPMQKPRTYKGGMPEHRFRLVVDFIQAHLDRDLRLTDLARLAGMSPHYFAQLFRDRTGHSPHQYVLTQRIERAKRLLRNHTLSALDVGLLLGFADASHFSKIFSRAVGATPSRYRANL